MVPFASKSPSNSPPSPPHAHLKHSGSSSTPSSSPPERAHTWMRTRTSSMSRGMVPPDLSNLSLDDGSRGPRHLDLSNSSIRIPSRRPTVPAPSGEVPPAVDDRERDGNGNGGYYRKRRMSVISQVSEAGSMVTTLTGATAGMGVTYEQQEAHRSPPDGHHRQQHLKEWDRDCERDGDREQRRVRERERERERDRAEKDATTCMGKGGRMRME
ncbi:hypothetical protein EST38_g12442 [Candolleomyces aberdarensis]|uniref:Uncharacterized protein n=1 Tax=Candolleomyces aberdarensis TaxID=2316362 RepID=A0A4Q2D2E8_9AGAR|nr:hypothetical protein EST38_g12442 [Candolleomyces aberdarensis]